MRTFIAINLPDSIKKALECVILELKNTLPGINIKFTETHNLHITLHFLNDLDPKEIERVHDLLDGTVLQFSKVIFQLDELRAFPNVNNPKIIHIKVNEIGDGNITRLQKELQRGLLNLGFEVDDRNWVPHITIGRVKDQGVKFSIPELQIEPVEWEVNSIDLMGSELRPAGPEYYVVRKFKLK